MNIIFVRGRHGRSNTVSLRRGHLIALLIGFVMVITAIFSAGYALSLAQFSGESGSALLSSSVVDVWKTRMKQQREDITALKGDVGRQVDALTLRLGDLQARLLRLDALGQRLTEVAKLGDSEFDFASSPAMGGPLEPGALDESYTVPDLQQMLATVEARLDSREQQLELLDALLVNRQIESERFITGRPIKLGWMSSQFGYRSDPFNGKRAWHAGVDFAGKEGSSIVAVAAGVVTWSSDRNGYGNLVEVDHGNGLITRYGHCKEITVKLGDIVQKGQVLASMGSSGRSTGPHVHFEVLKDGRAQNPAQYMFRASR